MIILKSGGRWKTSQVLVWHWCSFQGMNSWKPYTQEHTRMKIINLVPLGDAFLFTVLAFREGIISSVRGDILLLPNCLLKYLLMSDWVIFLWICWHIQYHISSLHVNDFSISRLCFLFSVVAHLVFIFLRHIYSLLA